MYDLKDLLKNHKVILFASNKFNRELFTAFQDGVIIKIKRGWIHELNRIIRRDSCSIEIKKQLRVMRFIEKEK